MGGIVGIQHRNVGLPREGDIIDRMLAEVHHRGDASIKQLCASNVFLGATYSKDVQSKRRAVAFNESKNLCAVLDGEIFFNNFDNSCFSSENPPVSPFSQGGIDGPPSFPNRGVGGILKGGEGGFDAEILLSLYEAKKADLLSDVDGSYAVAVWDGQDGNLLLARDRVGCKPLFYLVLPDAVLFASEIKAILTSGLYKASVDLRALNNFLSYGYIPGPDTLFESIRQVRPGHILICKDGDISEKPYWKFTYRQDEGPKSEVFYKEKFLEIFEAAVSRRLERHPDAGAFLSGGLDTSAVVAVMHKLNGAPFKVFTAGFEEEKYNEIGDAKILADYLGLEHHTVTVKFDRDFPALLEKLVWHHDAPFADTSAIPSYYAARLAREYVDVVLTGDFPDQLIGGSGHHAHALYRESHDPAWKKMLRWKMRRGVNKRLNELVARLPWRAGGSAFSDRVKRFMYRETFSLEEQRVLLAMPVPPLLKRCLYGPELLEVNEKYDPLDIARSLYQEAGDVTLLDKLLYFDIHSYAPDDLMVKVDRMTQSHGLNAISPFHDLELVEFMATVPTHLKIRGSERKYIMREALRPMLPEQTLNKKKQGFAMPIGEWLMRNLSGYVRDVLLDSRTLNRGYFNKKFMRKMVENFLVGKTDYASGSEATIISLITLELWHRTFIDK